MRSDAGTATDKRSSDQPLTHPDQDLLGIASHAAVLARQVSTTATPFTIGVYGEWGAGKTTFVRFVEHYLAHETDPRARPTLFVHFEGWQHRTADELWRALMLELARAVYVRKAGKAVVVPLPEKQPWSLRRLLATEAVVVRDGSPEQEPAQRPQAKDGKQPEQNGARQPEQESEQPEQGAKTRLEELQKDYWNFVERLDATMYGGISKRSPEALRLDQDEAVLAAVRASVAALSAASPVVSGLRQLLGIDTTVDTAALFQRERNEAARERIESRREFQNALESLLALLDRDERVCVFLDDLDRCMPDVMLDLLEAIKIFLHVEKMVFVVAADEELIGKGLRLRYRELVEGSAGAQEGEFLARKGQEYFEKIIQLRINLPECTPEHAHRFIAAQYPEWMPATDIILSAVGSNPRRLKQYCSWLEFRRRVDLAEREKKNREEKDPQRRRREKRNTSRETYLPAVTEPERAARAALFDKLIALASRDRTCLALVHDLAREADFAMLVMQREADLAKSASRDGDGAAPATPGDVPAAPDGGAARDAAANDDTPAGRLAELCRRMKGSAPLLEHFRAGPALSACARRDVETLAAMADLRPHPELMLTAGDGAFMRALRHLPQPGTTAPERIFQEDLAKLIAIQESYPLLFAQLLPLAAEDAAKSWAAGTLALESALQTRDAEGLPGDWAKLFEEICEQDQAVPADASPTALLTQGPRLSEILPEEVRALGGFETLPDAGMLPPATIHSAAVTPTEADRRRRVARSVFEALAPALRTDVLARLELRQWAAAHCLELRGFARLNALERQWPELARLLRTDRATLRALEGEAMRPGSIAPEHRGVWERYSADERLRRFLVLKPLVSDIAPAEVREYFSVSQSIAPAADVSGTPAPAPPAATAAQPPPARPRFDYADVVVTLVEKDSADLAPPPAVPGSRRRRPMKFEVVLEGPRGTVKTMTEVPWAQLIEMMPSLYRRELDGPASLAPGAGEPSQRPRTPESALRALGALMWRWVFKDEVGRLMQELHGTGAAYRLLLEFPSQLASLPWETLFLEPERSFLGLTQRYSLVRYMRSAAFPPPVAITAPLRILIVLVNPPGHHELDLDSELSAITEAVRPGLQDGRVLLQVLSDEAADPGELQRTLRTFRPQIFHFTGHGILHEEEGALVLSSTHGPHVATASHVATLLRDAGVSLAFLNSCNTGKAAEDDAMTSVAGSLVAAGVPAVIGTMRQIEDTTGLLFTREWYRAFAEGYPLEAAVAEARKRLSVERWDWSAFALFSSTRDLDDLMFPQGTYRRQ